VIALSSGNFGVQGVRTLLPKIPVVTEPGINVGERLGAK